MPRDPGRCVCCWKVYDGGSGYNLTGGNHTQICTPCWDNLTPTDRLQLFVATQTLQQFNGNFHRIEAWLKDVWAEFHELCQRIDDLRNDDLL